MPLAAALHEHVLLPNRFAPAPGCRERRAKRMEQSIAGHLQQVETRLARRCLEVRARVAAEVHDVEIGVHYDGGRRVLVENETVRLVGTDRPSCRGAGAGGPERTLGRRSGGGVSAREALTGDLRYNRHFLSTSVNAACVPTVSADPSMRTPRGFSA